MTDLIWRIWSWFTGIPVEQLKCDHLMVEARVKFLPEENGMDFYEQCVQCGKEFR